MRIAVCSDLHLEFSPIELVNEQGADVLILSGDILVEQDLQIYDRRQVEYGFMHHRSLRFHKFFEQVCEQFPHVIYVAGNHEHYHGDFALTLTRLKEKLQRYENLHILDKECVDINGYLFVGSTLWTDMNKEDPITLHAMKTMLNDFRCVRNSNRQVYHKVPVYEYDSDGNVAKNEAGQSIQIGMKMKEEPAKFSPEDSVVEHRKCLDYIKLMTSDMSKKCVVVGHHTPSFQSCADKYRGDHVMNGGYHSSLEDYILDRPQIKLWTHGHTHELFDYMIGDTRIVCNPRGYHGYEESAEIFELKYLEI